jgi:hypothetical protein
VSPICFHISIPLLSDKNKGDNLFYIALRLMLRNDHSTHAYIDIMLPFSDSIIIVNFIGLTLIDILIHKLVSLLTNIFLFIAECRHVFIIFLCIEIISFKTSDLIYYNSILLSYFHELYGEEFFCYQIHVGLYKSISRPLTKCVSSPNVHRWFSQSVTA